jgi:hypothetical protein
VYGRDVGQHFHCVLAERVQFCDAREQHGVILRFAVHIVQPQLAFQNAENRSACRNSNLRFLNQNVSILMGAGTAAININCLCLATENNTDICSCHDSFYSSWPWLNCQEFEDGSNSAFGITGVSAIRTENKINSKMW